MSEYTLLSALPVLIRAGKIKKRSEVFHTSLKKGFVWCLTTETRLLSESLSSFSPVPKSLKNVTAGHWNR